jgi:hypothetical protein
MSEAIENRIRALLRAKTTSQALSNALFGPGGLFGKLAKTEQERRALTQTPLFQQAEARIMEIERAELAAKLQRIEEVCPPAIDLDGTVNGVGEQSSTPAPKMSATD